MNKIVLRCFTETWGLNPSGKPGKETQVYLGIYEGPLLLMAG